MDTKPQTLTPDLPMAGLTASLPAWRRPAEPRQDPTLPGETETDEVSPAGPGVHPEPSAPGRPRTSTRTRISSTGDERLDTAVLVAATLGLVAAGTAWAVRAFSRRRLRRPTREQLRDIGTPIAQLLTRTWDETRVDANLVDVANAGAAILLYLEDGPLLTPDLLVDPGVPTNLQEGTDQ